MKFRLNLDQIPFCQVRDAQNSLLSFLDLKCGNLMVQKVTRLETNEGNEIAALIGQYIDMITNQEQQQHHPITVL